MSTTKIVHATGTTRIEVTIEDDSAVQGWGGVVLREGADTFAAAVQKVADALHRTAVIGGTEETE